jgi:asparagine synthase (glutamine-hydrolysing)
MALFCFILYPPGVAAQPGDGLPLLKPVGYLGAGDPQTFTRGRVAIASLNYSTAEAIAGQDAPIIDPSNRYVFIGDVRLNSRDDLARLLAPAMYSNHRNSSDRDLVLAAYMRWGEQCCEHFDGDYAFAIFDFTARRLFAAADPLGSYRLFKVALKSGAFLLTSELSCALAASEPDVSFSMPDLLLWLSGYFLRSRTLFEHIAVVPPGYSFTENEGRSAITRWWSPQNLIRRIRYTDQRDYAQHYLRVLRDCVHDRMQSATGKVLVELSGGLDSSSIAALALEEAEMRGLQVTTVSHVYDHPDCAAEREAIRTLRQHFRCPYIDLDGSALTREYLPLGLAPRPESPLAFRQPFQIHAAGHARAIGADLILTGAGGDEMTVGNLAATAVSRLSQGDLGIIRELWVRSRRRQERFTALVAATVVKPILKRALGPSKMLRVRRHTGRLLPWTGTLNGISRDFQNQHIAAAEALIRETTLAEKLTTFEHDFFLGLRTTPSFNARDAYRLNAGRHGVTTHDPFLDLRLASFYLSTPPALWRNAEQMKLLPRRAMTGYLPDSVREARKFTVLAPQLEVWQASQDDARALVARLTDAHRLQAQLRAALETGGHQPYHLGVSITDLYALCLVSWSLDRTNQPIGSEQYD